MLKNFTGHPPLPESGMPLTSLLFDLDGTLVDTEPLHYLCHKLTLANYGVEISEAQYYAEMSGRSSCAILQKLLPNFPATQHQQIIRERRQLFLDRLNLLKPIPGAKKILAWAERKQLRLILVTSATRFRAQTMLNQTGLSDSWSDLITIDDVTHAKPHPFPYQVALERNRIDFRAAYAFEDTPVGIRSSTQAGLSTFGITSAQTPAVLKEAGAYICFKNYNDAQLWSLLKEATKVKPL